MEGMSEQFSDGWERHVKETAASFPYPATPDMAGAVRQGTAARQTVPIFARQRLAWVLVLILLIIGGLMAVPQVRAAVLQIIRAGAITIFVSEPRPTVPPVPKDEFIFELATPVTLADAQAKVKYPLRLPAYPYDLGSPDQVYLQEMDRQTAIIMVWLKPTESDEVQLSLYYIEGDDYAYKGTERVEFSRVNGREAIWLEAPHIFRLQNGRYEPWLFVEGSVLIWSTSEGVTYRLESGLSLAEAVRIAESLK